MRTLLLVNDSLFAYAQAAPIIQTAKVVGVVLSRATTGSRQRLSTIARRASKRYLFYRVLIQCGRRRVARLAAAHSIPTVVSRNINAESEVLRGFAAAVAVAVSFDQILRAPTLAIFPKGVLNFHASRLPADRGISPALWAFARGDDEIWLTLYRMDAGLDTGPIYDQTCVRVEPGESAAALYWRVCSLAGRRMATLLEQLHGRVPVPQTEAVSPAHSWPDHTFDAMLRRSRRRLICWRDVPMLLAT